MSRWDRELNRINKKLEREFERRVPLWIKDLEARGFIVKELRDSRIEITLDPKLGAGNVLMAMVAPAPGGWSCGVRHPRKQSHGLFVPDGPPPSYKADALEYAYDWADASDILEAAARRSGDTATYVVDFNNRELGEWWARFDEPEGIVHLGAGRVRFTATAIAYLRGQQRWSGVYVQGTSMRYSSSEYALVRE